jgi:hypothetical protein
MIVDDSDLGIISGNVVHHEGNGTPCKHLVGEESGKYSCIIHDKEWYKDTPCFSHGQMESSPDNVCRLGDYILNKKEKF